MFPEIIAAHHAQVWKRVRRRGLEAHDAEDLVQEIFLELHNHILARGFLDSLFGMLRKVTKNKLSNHVRARKRAPFSIGLPSSSSEKASAPDIDRALDLRELVRRLVSQLSPEHQEVVDKVILKDLSDSEAAAALGLATGTVKSRLIAARRALVALAEPFLPPSQRGLP